MKKQVEIIDRYDRALLGQEDRVLTQVNSILASSYANIEKKLRGNWDKKSNLIPTQRQLLLADQIKDLYPFIDPSQAKTVKKAFKELLGASTSTGQKLADELLRVSAPKNEYDAFTKKTAYLPIEALTQLADKAYDSLSRYSDEFKSTIINTVGFHLSIGSGIGKAANSLRVALGVTQSKAEMLVRTESLNAFNNATKDFFQQREIQYFQYIATQDKRLCPFCAYRNMKIYKLGESQPPIHPRCRCTLVPYAKSWEQAGLINQEEAQQFYENGVAQLENGKSPNSGASPFERYAGLPAPTPINILDTPDVPLPAAPEPEVITTSLYNDDEAATIRESQRSLYEAARDNKPTTVTKKERELAHARMTQKYVGLQETKIDKIRKEFKAIDQDEAESLAFWISNDYQDMNKRFYAYKAFEDEAGQKIDSVNKLCNNALLKMDPVTDDYLVKKAKLKGASYEPGQTLDRYESIDDPNVLASIVKKYQDGLDSGENVLVDQFFAVTHLSADEMAGFSDGANIIYKVNAKMDGTGRGRYIDHYKNEMSEGEVLYPAMQHFKPTKITVRDNPGAAYEPEQFILDSVDKYEKHQVALGMIYKEKEKYGYTEFGGFNQKKFEKGLKDTYKQLYNSKPPSSEVVKQLKIAHTIHEDSLKDAQKTIRTYIIELDEV